MTLFLDAPRDVEKPVVQAAAAETVAAPASQATDQQALAPQPAAPAKEPTAAIPASVVVTHDASAVPANAAAALLQPQASAPAAVASMQTLETGDARWARNDQATSAQADQQENASAPRQELAQNDGTDSATTSGIVPIKPADAQNVLADEQPAEPAAAQPVAADGGNGSSAVTTVAVKMRAKESNDAKVIAVLPARAPVDVLGCKAWCKVSYKGQEGFIYKRFVQR
ncbi:SH3 domain-containing protein [Pseudaminobacter salicylatoxidans]|nr:SH3 domain-containing protein [Pseudaminobacter salicylatoxidans]